MKGTVWRRGTRVRRHLLLLPLLTLLVGAESGTDRFDTVVIDAGHGGDDRGARADEGLYEKDLVLDVAKRLSKTLRERGLRVVMTRERDEFVSLERRTAVANDARGDLFVSIHANAARTRAPRGTETYFASLDASDEHAGEVAARENRSFAPGLPEHPASAAPLLALLGDLIATEHLAGSSEFARLTQRRLAGGGEVPSRGVKQAPFVVLMGVQMPAALVEIGFLSNPEDVHELRAADHRTRLARSLAEAVVEFGRRYDARRGVEASRSLVAEGS